MLGVRSMPNFVRRRRGRESRSHEESRNVRESLKVFIEMGCGGGVGEEVGVKLARQSVRDARQG